MNHQITYRQVINRLETHHLPYSVLPLQQGAKIVITLIGARVLGPFLSDDSPSLGWLNSAFANEQAFADLVASGGTGLGGARWWIAPEVQYNVQDRFHFDETYAIQPAMDPGHYNLQENDPAERRLTQTAVLHAYNTASGAKTLEMALTLRPAQDPLHQTTRHAELLDGVTFAGYEESMVLSQPQPDGSMSAAWNLIQLNPGGMILIPASPQVEWHDYYEPVGSGQEIHTNHVRVHITGQRRYKMGYRAAHTFGRMAYFNTLDQDRAYLMVRSFTSNPAAYYIDEPGSLPGCRGDSIQVYNDSGALGGFGEME
ncbi:MAG: hypothetical protein HY866_05000, partial [Chloroflexi bacterium]|nr:hypothetical protein [Chloroflexota bacterium]